jgi:hypothetical protein
VYTVDSAGVVKNAFGGGCFSRIDMRSNTNVSDSGQSLPFDRV